MLKAYKITFNSPSTQIRSYTLFGAICWAYSLMGGDLESLLSKFEKEPPFIISSPFPVAKTEEGKTVLFPKPIIPISTQFERDDNICVKINRKDFKKTKYVTFKALKHIIENKFFEEKYLHINGFKVNNSVIHLNSEGIPYFKETKDLSVRNVLNRVTMKSENLFTEEVYFYTDKVFFIKYFYSGYINTVETCLNLIEDLGVGANKNLGWGNVEIEDTTRNIKDVIEFIESRMKNGKAFITLSPLLPKKDSLNLSESYYNIETYKSPIDTTFGRSFIWKRKVMYLTEGSFLKPSSGGWVGNLKEVGTNETKAFQYGYEFPLSVEG